MNNKPICGRWHSGNVMPREFEPCIFEIRVNDKKEMIIGCWRRGKIVKINESYRSCPAHKGNVQQAETLQRLHLSRC